MLSTRTKNNHRSWQLETSHVISYDVVETSDIFSPDNDALMFGDTGRASRRFVVVDEVVYDTRVEQIHGYFEQRGVEARIFPIAATEQNKTFDLFFQIARELDAFRLDRRHEPIIAMGGGVLTDVVSMVASCYRRGTPCVRVPTTLMGCVDAAIGVKTAVNFNGFKNRIGSFEAPIACILDRSFLSTLPMRHILNGLSEIVKLALIRSAPLFELLEAEGKAAVLDRFQTKGTAIFRDAIHVMLEELQHNLFETVLERAVDYGHTFSPILEMQDIHGVLHGEAVAIDAAFSAILAQERGLIPPFLCNRVLNTMADLGLPLHHPLLDADMLWAGLEERTAHRDGFQRVPLMKNLGEATFVNDITRVELAHGLDVWRKRCAPRSSMRLGHRPLDLAIGEKAER
jgi:3-dehydroquinate synthetase